MHFPQHDTFLLLYSRVRKSRLLPPSVSVFLLSEFDLRYPIYLFFLPSRHFAQSINQSIDQIRNSVLICFFFFFSCLSMPLSPLISSSSSPLCRYTGMLLFHGINSGGSSFPALLRWKMKFSYGMVQSVCSVYHGGCTHDMPYIIRARGIYNRLELYDKTNKNTNSGT